MIPEGSPKYNDLIDVVTQSAQTTVDVVQKDGSITKENVLNQEILWWKTNSINSNEFGRFAFELKEWERQARECFNHMTEPRAQVMAEQIIAIGESYRRSIDAKSSESKRDKHNSQSTLLDKLGKNKVEKVFTTKGEAKRSLMDAFLGKEADKELDD